MCASLNPFRSTGPIRDGETFLDRERELRLVLEALAKGQSVQVYGPRRRGKTSLLFAVQRALKEQNRPHRYFTLESFPTARAFWQALAREVGQTWAPEAPDYLSLGEALAAKKMVLLLDELDRAIADHQAYPDDFFVALRGLEVGQGVPFVVAAKRPLGQYERFHRGPTSPFGNTFLPLPLPPFDKPTAAALLAPLGKRAAAAGWPDDWVERLYQAAEGEPWKLQRFGERLWEAASLPPWKEALSAWQSALQEEAGPPAGPPAREERFAAQPPPKEQTEGPAAAEPRPWYLTPAFLGVLLMTASGLGLVGLSMGSLSLGVVALLLFVLLFVLVLRYLGQ